MCHFVPHACSSSLTPYPYESTWMGDLEFTPFSFPHFFSVLSIHGYLPVKMTSIGPRALGFQLGVPIGILTGYQREVRR